MSVEEFVAIAVVSKPRGVRGEVAAKILTDFPERFDELEKVFAVGAPKEKGKKGEIAELEIERFFFHKEKIVFKFKNFDSFEQAETLRGAEICIPEAEAVKLEADEFFEWDLVGCEVSTLEGELIGRVKEIFRAGENINLVVASAASGEKEFMIPFVEAICPEVDIEEKKIRVDLPEGLLEL